MKISSASKKVLASALSAAMVVAFAPTVAFGAATNPVKVNIDPNGGSGVAIPSYTSAVEGGDIALPLLKNQGYTPAAWAYDKNGDGVIEDTETLETYSTTTGVGKLPVKSETAMGEITLKAIYHVPAIEKLTYNDGFLGIDTAYVAAGMKIKVYDVNNQAGTVVTIQDASVDLLNAGRSGYAWDLDFGVAKAAGTYTVQLLKADNTVLDTETLTVSKLSLKNANGTDATPAFVLAGKGQTAADLAGLWVNEAGNVVDSSYVVKGDETLTAVEDAKCVISGGSYADRNMSFTYTAGNDEAGTTATYKVAV